MSGAYLFRLLAISLACFFLLNAALGTLLALWAPAVRRLAERMSARQAARLVLAARLLPATAACFLVAALGVPSYLRLEPRGASEDIGIACLAGAILGLSVWGISLARSARALATSAFFARDSRRLAKATALEGEALPVWVMERAAGFPMALIGLLRARLVISRGVLEALSPDQLAAALRHEHAHHVSRDNLKRLLLMLTPGLIPFVNTGKALDQDWVRFTEWAADDAAVGGDRQGSLSLAAALVLAARTCPPVCPNAAIAFLVGSGCDLAARVDRLLDPPPAGERLGVPLLLAGGAILVLAGATVVLAFEPAVLSWVHEALELLIR
jgi:Zn-dependent protease with chaperone function